MRVHQSRVGAVDVARAVLEAHQVARGLLVGAVGRGLAEPELRPPHHHGAPAETGEVADHVERHDRVVGAGLDAQVAVAALRIEVRRWQVRQVGERGRTLAGEPEPLVEQARAEPERDGQVCGRRAVRLAGVGRWRGRIVDVARHRLAGRHRRRRLGPRLEQRDQGGPALGDGAVRDEVVGRERQPCRRRRGDAGLVRAVERDHGPLALTAAGAVARSRRLSGAGGGDPREGRPAELQQPASVQCGHQPVTLAATWDSGSARASTFWVSTRRWASVTVE